MDIKLNNNRGSFSLESTLVVPAMIFMMVVLISTVKFMYIDDVFNQCFYQSIISYSNIDSTKSDVIETGLFNGIMLYNIEKSGLNIKPVCTVVIDEEFVRFHGYYNVNLPILNRLTFKEENVIIKPTRDYKTYVYVTPHGKRYHYKDCILMKGNGSKVLLDEVPNDVTPCKNCIIGHRYFDK